MLVGVGGLSRICVRMELCCTTIIGTVPGKPRRCSLLYLCTRQHVLDNMCWIKAVCDVCHAFAAVCVPDGAVVVWACVHICECRA